MAHLLFLKPGNLSPEELNDLLLKVNVALIGSYAGKRFQFAHTCISYKLSIKWEREKVLSLRNSLKSQSIDVIYIEEYLNSSLPNLFCFDMDSTVIKEEVIDELARKHGVFDEVSSVTKQAMEGGMNFDEALRLRVKHLKGLSLKSFEEVYHLLNLSNGMEIILSELPKNHSKIAILSGGFNPVLELFSKKYPIQYFRANELEVKDGFFTGEILGEIINKEKKAFYLTQMILENHLSHEQTVAVGDGANDAMMLNTAKIGIGFHAKQGLKDNILNWIDYCDMSVLLFLFRERT
ncbi:MAG: phosphoserine phosphatase SerB [Leptospira sp.]|nr:phosphoserine phosphatase SerB [Leptospira sp.]